MAALVLVATACPKSKTTSGPQVTGTRGGILKLIAASDTDHIDAGQTYIAQVYGYMRVVHRTLMAFPAKAGDAGLIPEPDVADGPPTLSDDGKTFTFKIRDGVRFSPPVNRQVTSKDFKYAIERTFNKNVGGQYTFYLTGKVGAPLLGAEKREVGDASPISGIETPDDRTIVFKLAAARADFPSLLTMPAFAPVPVEYATPHDAKSPSTYGEHQVATGPYMFKNDAQGNIKGSSLGWDPGKKVVLVRNTSWQQSTDPIRKDFPDQIELHAGFTDAAIMTDKVNNGEFDVMWDTTPPAEKVQAIRANPEQSKRFYAESGNTIRYVSLNTTIEPFTNVHVRKAVAWVLNRDALRKTRGGPEAGDFATAPIIPGLPGYDESGGASLDPYKTPEYKGDLTKAIEEMKLARTDGVANIGADGKYTGPPLLLVYSATDVHTATMNQVAADLEKLGIRTTRRGFDPDTMYTQWAERPAKKVGVLTSVAWGYDYPSSASFLIPLIQGPGPTGFPAEKNQNFSLWDDKTTNDIITQINATTDPKKQGELFGDLNERIIDQVPIVPWLWSTTQILVSARVKNYVFSALTSGPDLAVLAVQ